MKFIELIPEVEQALGAILDAALKLGGLPHAANVTKVLNAVQQKDADAPAAAPAEAAQ